MPLVGPGFGHELHHSSERNGDAARLTVEKSLKRLNPINWIWFTITRSKIRRTSQRRSQKVARWRRSKR